jgi:predicted dehydrogenase
MTHTVSIIGAGIGEKHLWGFAEVPELFTVHSVCDLNEDRGRALAASHPGTLFIKDYAEVLADPEIDFVDICLPPHLHFQACIDALEAGKKIICEKPLVSSLQQADQLLAKLAATSGFLSPVFQYRYGLGMAQLQALIAAGLAGRAYAGSLETHWNRPASYYDVVWRGTWRGEMGGALLGHAIHIHDLLPTLLGPVAKVYADVATRVNQIEVEDCAALSIRMASGALITSSVTLGCAEDISRLRLMFEGFTVESDHEAYRPADAPWRFIARAPTTQAQIDAVLAKVPQPLNGYAGLFSAIAQSLAGQEAAHVTAADGRRSLEFVTAVYASARSGQAVTLPLDQSHPLYAGWQPAG